jgi:hypothetical protein
MPWGWLACWETAGGGQIAVEPVLIETFAAKDLAQAVDYGERAEAIARQHGLKEAAPR